MSMGRPCGASAIRIPISRWVAATDSALLLWIEETSDDDNAQPTDIADGDAKDDSSTDLTLDDESPGLL